MGVRKQIEVVEVDESECAFSGTSFKTHSLFQKKYCRTPYTKATEFLTIDDLAVSPSANWAKEELSGGTDIFVSVRINSTDYFCGVDGSENPGVPGLLSPYPEGFVTKRFRLYPPIYVLPGQNFELHLHHKALEFASDSPCKKIFGSMEYTRFDGTDAVLAVKLLEQGLLVCHRNVDWYKRSVLLAAASGGPVSMGMDEATLVEFKHELLEEIRKVRELRTVAVSDVIDSAVQRSVRRELEKIWD